MIIYLCLSSNYVFYLCSTCSTINVTDSKQCYLYFICQVFLTYTCISSGIIFFSFQCKWLCIPLWLSKLCILSLSMISLEIDVSQSVSLKKKKDTTRPTKTQRPNKPASPIYCCSAPRRDKGMEPRGSRQLMHRTAQRGLLRSALVLSIPSAHGVPPAWGFGAKERRKGTFWSLKLETLGDIELLVHRGSRGSLSQTTPRLYEIRCFL